MSHGKLYPVIPLLLPALKMMSREAAPKSPPVSSFSPQNLYWHLHVNALSGGLSGESAGRGQKAV